MKKNLTESDNNIAELPIAELRRQWSECWGKQPHLRISRTLLEKSLAFKLSEARGEGFSAEQQKQLAQLITAYKRNPQFFDEGLSELKPGVRLVKSHNGMHHSVLVLADGFEYCDKHYGSLSEIAFAITGTRWNGWVFFGLKKRKAAS